MQLARSADDRERCCPSPIFGRWTSRCPRVRSVAFPCLSTGIFGFDKAAAADIALDADDDEQLYVTRWAEFFPAPESTVSFQMWLSRARIELPTRSLPWSRGAVSRLTRDGAWQKRASSQQLRLRVGCCWSKIRRTGLILRSEPARRWGRGQRSKRPVDVLSQLWRGQRYNGGDDRANVVRRGSSC
jgi:hypothetical protein